ncbi:MAG: hypothetical protein J6J15_01350 [Oscillospiraceae bacterium]|nr:hypothetical protein [Oscillospiraceae bacterium]
MALKIQSGIVPDGNFAVAKAGDIEMPDGKRVDAALEEAGKLLDENSGERVRMWFGTQEEFDALEKTEEDVYYNIFEDEVEI